MAQSQLIRPLEFTTWFKLQYAENTGIAWSIPIPQAILIPLNILLLAIIPIFALKHLDFRYYKSKIILTLILGGALGNITDRILHGYVIDFISVGTWPIFNLADSFLCIGIFLLFVFYAKIKRST